MKPELISRKEKLSETLKKFDDFVDTTPLGKEVYQQIRSGIDCWRLELGTLEILHQRDEKIREQEEGFLTWYNNMIGSEDQPKDDDKLKAAWVNGATHSERKLQEEIGLKLAACSCAALMDTERTHPDAKIDRDNPAWSAAYEDVMRRTEECMHLREAVKRLKNPQSAKNAEKVLNKITAKWNEWINSLDGKAACNRHPSIIGPGHYLENRLRSAFLAGAALYEKEIMG
jgi:hypothetical protein